MITYYRALLVSIIASAADISIMFRLNNSSLRANFSPLVENTIEIKTDKKPSQNFINKISVIDEKIKDLESKIENVIYSDIMTFSKLALIGFYTLRIYSLIESIEPDYKNHSLLLVHKRKMNKDKKVIKMIG